MPSKLSSVCYFLFSGLALASSSEITTKNLKAHVAFLSSDALEGRLTGSKGEKLATQYVADVFQRLGLEPAGDKGTFFQDFYFNSGISFGKNNSFSITNQKGITRLLTLDREWRPLSFSDTIAFESKELVFAGYGITAPALGTLPAYDSYHGLNVKDKWVVVFRYTPEQLTAEQNRQLTPYTSPRYKAFTAKNHGAKGIIFVSGPNSKVKNELISLSFDASLSGSGIAAISVKDQIIDDLLKNSPQKINSLQKLQNILDLGSLDASPTLTNIKIKGHIDIKQNKKQGRNVLAKLRFTENATKMIVLSAHVDHLGHGELSGSREKEHEKGLIHYGADDNASGVASILEAAIALNNLKTSTNPHMNKDILFAIWSGEELGLLGSAHFVKEFMRKSINHSLRPKIDANINLDMVGRLRKNLILQGTGSSAIWLTLIKRIQEKSFLSLTTQNDPYLPTDSTSFYLHGVPTINFFTGSHDEYHSCHDTPLTLNYEGMKNITNFLVDFTLALEEESKPVEYSLVSKKGDKLNGRFRVYLGTIPDYASTEVSGVKLSGVTKDSPADYAGLKPNDVILELAGEKIHNIYDYTFVLSALHVGKSVPVLILRDQDKIALTVVGRSRE